MARDVHIIRVMRTSSLCAALAAIALVASAAPAEAQEKLRSSIGPHLGVNFDGDDFYLGLQGRVGVAEITPTVLLQLYPSASYYFVGDRGPYDFTVLNFSFDVPFEFVIDNSVLRPYAAPGLGIWYAHFDTPVGSDSDIDLSLNLLGGLLFALGNVEPFFELRIIIDHGADAELRGGVVFVL